ncbi:MAG: hypothetical protein ACPLRT_01105 [Thermoproteota archaeon]
MKNNLSQKIAHVASIVLSNPIVDSIFAFIIALNESFVKNGSYDVKIAFVSTFLLGIAPYSGAFVMYLRNKSDIFVSEREKRPILMIAGMIPLFLSAFYFYYIGYRWLSALATIFFLESLVYFLITLRWKISLHVSGLSIPLTTMSTMIVKWSAVAISGTLAFLNFILTFVGFVMLPVLMWARVKVGAHTWSQVIVSAVLSILMTYYGLAIFGVQ